MRAAEAVIRLILVVDDEKNVLTGMSLALSLEGYDVVGASNGEEGLRRAAERRPDLIIADVMMPELNGFEMCRLLRRNPSTRDIPIILSSFADPGQPVERNWNVFMRKPVCFTTLLSQIRQLLPAA